MITASEFTSASQPVVPTYLLNAASFSVLVTCGGIAVCIGGMLIEIGMVLFRRLAFGVIVGFVVMGQPSLAVSNVVFKGGRGCRRGRPRRPYGVHGGY